VAFPSAALSQSPGEDLLWEVIDFNDFEDIEDQWGQWSNGGSDARIDNSPVYAKSGSRTVRLRENDRKSSIMTHDAMDVSSYSQLKVSFSFFPRSMETGQSFWLQVNNGSGMWENVGKWVSGSDFTNMSPQDDAVVFTPSEMSSNLQLRFRCDDSLNDLYLYFDDVEISGSI
jgi:hypothetical protein